MAHSWIDSLHCAATPQTLGYPRNYSSRTELLEKKVVFDRFMTYAIEHRNNEQPLCAPSQRLPVQTKTHPRLKCPPDATVFFFYNENGHVTNDRCQPGDPRGCDGVYPKTTPWTVLWDPSGDLGSATRRDATAAGSRLVEIGRGWFDDGNCGNTEKHGRRRAHQGQPCIALVWHWVFDKIYGVGEEYTTCFDVEIVSTNTTKK
ncbi:hypothetical protein ACHHYP_04236 [Achlya hypogyna]|uniref:DUF7492 domain-containing protein n=1 Tax=Achlya hypogyna TaxID=1202772 RepID=A0A1V9ZPD9_ACHHY|nr:hypothetical protein ACHHYP_04236 [Achlya hypogyna]